MFAAPPPAACRIIGHGELAALMLLPHGFPLGVGHLVHMSPPEPLQVRQVKQRGNIRHLSVPGQVQVPQLRQPGQGAQVRDGGMETFQVNQVFAVRHRTDILQPVVGADDQHLNIRHPVQECLPV